MGKLYPRIFVDIMDDEEVSHDLVQPEEEETAGFFTSCRDNTCCHQQVPYPPSTVFKLKLKVPEARADPDSQR